MVGKTYSGDFPNNKQRQNRDEQEQFLMKNAHEPIIKEEMYDQAQTEMQRRSNTEAVNGKTKRKDTHYSSKQEKQE